MSQRLVGYCRVSTTLQSLDAQIDALRAAGCHAIFGDDGVSGALASRPELDRCLASLNPGDILVVVRLDRLGRSAVHLATTIERLAERGIGFRSLKESIDTTTAAGRLILGIFGALSQFERDLIRERTTAALAAKRRRGETLGRPRALKPSQIAAALKMLQDGEAPSHVARLFKIDRSTLHRSLARNKIDAA